MDEPESLGAIGLAAREKLDNLIFVINCNLQRLDGPVRGNGKIIQELESVFRGAGWNVIKVIWGRDWDPLLAKDVDGALVHKMNTTPDGQFQTYSVESGSYIRENFFGDDPRLRKMVESLGDDDLKRLSRGGHDYHKVYAAFKAATEHIGQPTVIPRRPSRAGRCGLRGAQRDAPDEEAHQDRPQGGSALPAISDTESRPTCRPTTTQDLSPEIQYMLERRRQLGGFLPERRVAGGAEAPAIRCTQS
jgi:pyruvate dehydrogenase E1 component